MANNDTAATQMLEDCRRHNIGVPGQVAVLGVDDDEMAGFVANPPLASIATRARELGYEAARLLDRLMNGGAPPARRLRLGPKHVIVRALADADAVTDPDVAAAIEFIRQNSQRNINVDDVLTHVQLSRRTLERRFGTALNLSPLEYIQRVRVARARLLLSDTSLRIRDIAIRAGFGDLTRFNIIFKREVGCTPHEFRKSTRLDTTTS